MFVLMKYVLDAMDTSLGYLCVFLTAASCLCNARKLFYYDRGMSWISCSFDFILLLFICL